MTFAPMTPFETTPAAPAETDPALAKACDEVAKELLEVKPPKAGPLGAGEVTEPLPAIAVLALEAAHDAGTPEREEGQRLIQAGRELMMKAAARDAKVTSEALKLVGRELGTVNVQRIYDPKTGETRLRGVK